MAKSSVLRLGFGQRLDELLAAGATIDEIAEDLNGALERAGREERVSRSAVGRAAKAREGLLAAKRRQDELIAVLRAGSAPDGALEAQLDIVRTLLFETAAQALGNTDALSPAEMKDIAAGLLNVERAGHLSDQRIAEAEARARARAAQAAERAARGEGLSRAGAAAIRAAIEAA